MLGRIRTRQLIFAGLVLVGAGCNNSATPPATSSGPKAAPSNPTPAAPVTSTPPVDTGHPEPSKQAPLKLTVAEVLKNLGFKMDNWGKPVELTGFVSRVDDDMIYLLASKDSKSFDGLNCAVADAKDLWKQVTPGQTATFRGKVVSTPVLQKDFEDFVLVKAEGPRCPEVDAVELAKEFDAQPAETAKKYMARYEQYCILKGIVAKVENAPGGFRKFELKHPGKCKIQVIFNELVEKNKKAASSVKVGDTLISLGTIVVIPTSNLYGDARIDFVQARPLKDQ